MSVKSSISLTDQQDAFARSLVESGRYSSMSSVLAWLGTGAMFTPCSWVFQAAPLLNAKASQ
jgi:hypothetical protein